MALTRRGSAKRKDRERRAWLCAQPREVLDAVPGLGDDVTAEARALLESLCRQMYAIGLFGESAPAERQREIVRRLVSEFRGEHSSVQDW